MSEVYILLGPPGSGKSTQAKLLAEVLELPHISTGDIFRQMSQGDSPLGAKVKQILESGQLVDDALTLQVLHQYIDDPKLSDGFVLDGFPRNLNQAQQFTQPIHKAIYLDVPNDTLVERLLSRGRADDTQETITERISVYHEETEPILKFYEDKGNLLKVEGTATAVEIHKEIIKRLLR